MENRIKYILLKTLNEDGNISNLEKTGYQYATIAKEYSRLINDGLIEINEKMIFVLSEEGKKELKAMKEQQKIDKDWKIEPYVKYKTEKMNKYDIFIE